MGKKSQNFPRSLTFIRSKMHHLIKEFRICQETRPSLNYFQIFWKARVGEFILDFLDFLTLVPAEQEVGSVRPKMGLSRIPEINWILEYGGNSFFQLHTLNSMWDLPLKISCVFFGVPVQISLPLCGLTVHPPSPGRDTTAPFLVGDQETLQCERLSE